MPVHRYIDLEAKTERDSTTNVCLNEKEEKIKCRSLHPLSESSNVSTVVRCKSRSPTSLARLHYYDYDTSEGTSNLTLIAMFWTNMTWNTFVIAVGHSPPPPLIQLFQNQDWQEILGRTRRLLSFVTTRTAQKTKQLRGKHTDTRTARWSHKPPFISFLKITNVD
jgi:hypothetical protein